MPFFSIVVWKFGTAMEVLAMVTCRRRAALVSALVVLGVVATVSAVSRDLTFWKGDPHAWNQSGKCVLGAWGRVAEETYRDHLVIYAGALAPQSCEPVEIKVEATLWHWKKCYELNAKPGRDNIRLGRWKVIPLAGPHNLKRGSVRAELHIDPEWGPLGRGDIVRVRVTVRCKHGTTVESDAWYWYRL